MNDLLPISATAGERALALSISRISDVPTPARDLWNPDTCPVDLLPWLAWTLSVETWDATWPEHLKRSVIKSAVDVARHKGTKRAVVNALAAIGGSTVIVEWFEKTPSGIPHTFEVNIVGNSATPAMQALMISEVNRTKPLRSHFTVNFGISLEASVNVVGVLRPVVFLRLDGAAEMAMPTTDMFLPAGDPMFSGPDEPMFL